MGNHFVNESTFVIVVKNGSREAQFDVRLRQRRVSLHDLAAAVAEPFADAAWRKALLASGVVGTADAPGNCPLVLDAEGRLYLHRYFDYERRLAARLIRAQSFETPTQNAGRRALTTLLTSPGSRQIR